MRAKKVFVPEMGLSFFGSLFKISFLPRRFFFGFGWVGGWFGLWGGGGVHQITPGRGGISGYLHNYGSKRSP